jgi:ubiquinone/menaquinone biosynthesis C-methylase UbiE
MHYTLSRQILEKLEQGDEISLELGCGNHKRHKDALGVDRLQYPGVDIVGDIVEVIHAFPNNSVSAVFAYHSLEHLSDLGEVMIGLNRILKKNATCKVVVPHFSNPYFYSDYSHKTFFGLYTFCYFTHQSPFKRSVPNYGLALDFKLTKVKLIFKSPKPFYFRWGIKKLIQTLANLNTYLMEFYEENLCYIFPCYEVEYELQKT